MLVLEHSVQDIVVKGVIHCVLREFVENITLSKWSGIGLSIVLDDMIPQGTRYFQQFQKVLWVSSCSTRSKLIPPPPCFFVTVLMNFRTAA